MRLHSTSQGAKHAAVINLIQILSRHRTNPVEHLPGERCGDEDDEGEVVGEEFASHVSSTPGIVVTNSGPKNFDGVKLPERFGEARTFSTAASALRTVKA